MILYLWIIVILAVWQAKGCAKGYFSDYISIQNIQPVKGIFLLLVFVSHFVQYVTLKGLWDAPYSQVRSYLGQMVVVPFLFYSGYGIAESIRKKGAGYVKQLPRQRIAKVLFQFDLAVALFLVLRYLMGSSYGLTKILLTLIGWDGIGNSNWYIFAILFLYAATWLSFSVFRKSRDLPLVALTVLTVAFVLVMKRFKDGYWYNTALAYAAGMWFSRFRTEFDRKILSNDRVYWICLAFTAMMFIFLHKYWSHLWVYEASAVLFAFLIVFITAKLQITNRFLSYCGEHLFSLFILQRLPMMALNNTAIEDHPYLYFTVCFAATFLLSWVFDQAAAWLWKLFHPVKTNGGTSNV